ncbi:MAG: GNAT family N-acetyltransferase, partial [Pseudomonadota bacterium]
AWTVWGDAADRELGDALGRRGHVLDAKPMAMGADLAELTLPDVGDLEWAETDDVPLVSAINDAAFGFPPPAFAAAFVRVAQPRWRCYLGYLQGRPVATVLTHESDEGDCGVNLVATLPEARGHAIAPRLLTVALGRARDRGARTTTLQATSKGRPVYERLGYRTLGALAMWEHRVASP